VLLSKYGTIINNDTREILLSPEQLLQKYSFNTEECRGWRDKQYKYVGKYRMRGSAYKVDLNVYKAIGVSTKLETGV